MTKKTSVQELVPVTKAVIAGLENAVDLARTQQVSQALETIRKIHIDIAILKTALLERRDAAVKERQTAVVDLMAVNKDVGRCRDELQFCRFSIGELEGKITAADKALKDLETDIERLERELKAIEEKYNDKKESYDAAYDYSVGEFENGSPMDVFGSFVRGSTVMVATHAIESFDLEYKRLKEDLDERRSHQSSLSIQMSVSRYAATQLSAIKAEKEEKLAALEVRENTLHAEQGRLKVKVALLNQLMFFCASLASSASLSENDARVLLERVKSLDGAFVIESDDLSVRYAGTLRKSLTEFAAEYDRGLTGD